LAGLEGKDVREGVGVEGLVSGVVKLGVLGWGGKVAY
jgi:hypothetical protein